MREYSKLARWRDSSYYSLRNSSQKTHRLLNRISRKYNELLEGLMRPYFENFKFAAVPDEAVKAPNKKVFFSLRFAVFFHRKDQQLLSHTKQSKVSTSSSSSLPSSSSTTVPRWLFSATAVAALANLSFTLPPSSASTLLPRLSTFAVKAARKVSKLQTTGASSLLSQACVDTMEELSAAIIERFFVVGFVVVLSFRVSYTSHSFRSMHLRTSKANKLLKKKAFSDLLRYLGDIGVSHRLQTLAADTSTMPQVFAVKAPVVPESLQPWLDAKQYESGTGVDVSFCL